MDILTDEWRKERIRLGDENLERATRRFEELVRTNPTGEVRVDEMMAVQAQMQTLIQAAQAHYMAANVRGRA